MPYHKLLDMQTTTTHPAPTAESRALEALHRNALFTAAFVFGCWLRWRRSPGYASDLASDRWPELRKEFSERRRGLEYERGLAVNRLIARFEARSSS